MATEPHAAGSLRYPPGGRGREPSRDSRQAVPCLTACGLCAGSTATRGESIPRRSTCGTAPDEEELMSRDDALAIARDRGLHLIPDFPEHLTDGPASCRIGKVSLPVHWEQDPEAAHGGEPDPLPWFEAPCRGRDLLAGNGGAYPRRMLAWCPARQISYNVSRAEMGQMSQQARYYVAGFLAGNQPGPPPPSDPDAGRGSGGLLRGRERADHPAAVDGAPRVIHVPSVPRRPGHRLQLQHVRRRPRLSRYPGAP